MSSIWCFMKYLCMITNRWKQWKHKLCSFYKSILSPYCTWDESSRFVTSVLHFAASFKPSPLPVTRFDRRLKPLNHLLPLWSKSSFECRWNMKDLVGAAASLQILHHVYLWRSEDSHRLWSRLSSALLLPLGRIQVKAITSLRLKRLNPLLPATRDAIGWPLTFDLSHEGCRNNKTLSSKLSGGEKAAGWLWSVKSVWPCSPFVLERRKGFVMARSRRLLLGEPGAGCCKSPEIRLDFLFSTDSEPPDSLPRHLSASNV